MRQPMMAIALLACLSLPGCLTAGVMQLATGPRYRFARMTEVTSAARTATDIFVQVSVLRPGRNETEPLVLKVPIDEKEFWNYRHSVPDSSYVDGVRLAHVPVVETLPPGAVPIDAAPMPVESIEIDRIGDLDPEDRKIPGGIRVLQVHYKPVDDDLRILRDHRRGVPLPEDPLVAIDGLTVREEPNPVVISDIQVGHTTKRPWLLLMPFAAAADAVLLPFEFFVGLVNME